MKLTLMAKIFLLLSGLIITLFGLLSFLVGLAYQGQAGFQVALGVGGLMSGLGARVLLAFIRRFGSAQVKRRA